MTTLTLDQRAKRAATRKNNKLKRTHPLLADFFATTEQAEKERLQQWRAWFEDWQEKNRVRQIDAYLDGEDLRRIAKDILEPAQYEFALDLWRTRFATDIPAQCGLDYKAHWAYYLRGTQWAFEHCANIHRHNDPAWWQPHWHVTNGDWVETTHCPTCKMPRPNL